MNVQQAGCIILDSRMPNLRGQQVHQILNQANSPLAVIYLTGHGDVPMAVDALQAGAVNFFQKPVKGDELAQAILQGQAQSAANLDMAAAISAYESLTPREKDILRLIIAGKMLWSFIGGTSSVGWLESDEENWDVAVDTVVEVLQKSEGFKKLEGGKNVVMFKANIAIATK